MIDRRLFKRLREAKRLSQETLAKGVGASQQLIGEIERGAVRSTKYIYKIAQILDTTANVLDKDIPVSEGDFASLQQELAELDEEQANDLLVRWKFDLELVKKAIKRGG